MADEPQDILSTRIGVAAMYCRGNAEMLFSLYMRGFRDIYHFEQSYTLHEHMEFRVLPGGRGQIVLTTVMHSRYPLDHIRLDLSV